MKFWKKSISFLMAAVLMIGASIPAHAAVGDTGFSDVDANAWYAEAATYCRDNGLMSGTGGTSPAAEPAAHPAADPPIPLAGWRIPPEKNL